MQNVSYTQDYYLPYIWDRDIKETINFNGIFGGFSHLHIVGDAGLGKSRCAQEIINELEAEYKDLVVASYQSNKATYEHTDICTHLLLQLPVLNNAYGCKKAKENNHVVQEKAFCDAIEELAGHFPIVLIIEDLHYMDDLRDSLIEKIISVFQEAYIDLYLITTSRNECFSAKHHSCNCIRLEPFSKKDAIEFIEEGCLKDKRLEQYKDDIIDHAHGHPLFICEAVKITCELLEDEHETINTSEYCFLDSLGSLYARFFKKLNTAQQDVLKAASLIGNGFSFDEIDFLLPQYAAYSQDILDGFCKRHFLTFNAFYSRYEFIHSLQRQKISSLLDPQERCALHLALFHYYKKQKQFDRCADHLFDAGQFEQAIPYLTYTARKLLKNAQPLKAESYFLRAFEAYQKSLKTHLPSYLKLRIDYCQSLVMRGDVYKLQPHFEDLSLLLKECPSEKLKKQALGIEIPLRWISSNYDRQYVLNMLNDLPEGTEYIVDKIRLFSMLIDLGYSAEAVERIEILQQNELSKAQYFKEKAFTPVRITLHTILANAYAQLNDEKRTRDSTEAAIALLKDAASCRHKIYCLAFCAKAYQILGLYDQASPLIEEAYRLNCDYRIGIVTPDVLSIYADNLMHHKQDFLQALVIYDQLREFIKARGITANKSLHIALQAQAYQFFHMHELSIELLVHSLDIAKHHKNPFQEAYASMLMGQLLFQMNPQQNAHNASEAMTYLIKAERIARDLGAKTLHNKCESAMRMHVFNSEKKTS